MEKVEQQVFDPFESEENHDEKTPNKIRGQPWEMKMSESDKMEQKQRENEEIEKILNNETLDSESANVLLEKMKTLSGDIMETFKVRRRRKNMNICY